MHLTSEQDHRRTMDLLKIKTLRQGADGNNPQAPNAANYDESKANSYPNLPDPLVLNDGKKVTSAKTWWTWRRPEIVEDFDREIYGRVPKNVPSVHWEIISSSREMNGDVPVTTKKLVGHVDNLSDPQITVNIQLTLSTPASATGAVPVIMELSLSPDAMAALAKRFLDARPAAGPTWQQQVLAKGWGYAEYVPTSVQPDNGAGLTEGIVGLVNKGQPRSLADWGALRAWAWGASRVLDYFETDKSVDAKHVGIEGHSRYGKASLVAMAYDERFAIGYISSSGMGGAALYRRHFGELLENVAATNEYYWMAGNFLKYAGPLTPNDLPVDSHELIAICAPRPVLISAGTNQGDGWVDAKGMFLAAVGASPVYQLLGKKGLPTKEFPPIETPVISGDIGFRQHSGGHTPAPNWPTFLDFASRYLPSASTSGSQKSPTRDSQSETGGEVALTFDDLPSHGPLLPGLSRVDVAKRIIEALQAAHAPPTYGFVNAKALEQDPSTIQVLRLWRDSGFPLGNHTFSHLDANRNSAEAFERDVLADEPILQQLMASENWHWLRFPYLNEGNTREQHDAIFGFLAAHHYRVAEVSLSFGDYEYNDPYVRCLEKNDPQGLELLKKTYLSAAGESLDSGQKMARLVFGHDMRHIMLLHLGSFETVMLPQLLELLSQRQFRLITLPEAESDPAYAVNPAPPYAWSGTFLQQVLVSKHISPPAPDDPMPQPAAICR
jgi:peptidoglycan/xylan/chitin deacetylase (PgdA/CDA1 family)